MTARATRISNLFTSPGRGDVLTALAAFAALAKARAWDVEVVQQNDMFGRANVRGAADPVVIDLAVDATPERPSMATCLSPALVPDDLAGRKLVALFDRSEARDFADVYVLARASAHSGCSSWRRRSMPGSTSMCWP